MCLAHKKSLATVSIITISCSYFAQPSAADENSSDVKMSKYLVTSFIVTISTIKHRSLHKIVYQCVGCCCCPCEYECRAAPYAPMHL